ncbi:DUF5977 domain-containing protein [Flavobacterium mesophilum]|uniref:DUF5977 domain-containing protein n=1 Tax=Flavobacterium mesophilum TaxID=3143495 RepID=UPI0031E10601
MGNTGYKSFASLEEYYIDDNSPTGNSKPNVVSDPDYIAPLLDTIQCAPSPRYYNEEITRSAIKNDCNSGYMGTSVSLTALPNQFVSDSSVAEANAQAIAWLDNNVQIHANNSGACVLNDTTPPSSPTLTGTYDYGFRTLTLSWTAVSDPSSPVTYNVYSSNVFQESVTGTNRTYNNSWVNSGNNSWTVRAVDAAGNISGDSNVFTFVAL